MRLREVPSLASWLYCFNAYMAVRTTDSLTRQTLAYSKLIIREALRHGGSGWLEYNWMFLRQLAIDPSMSWNNLQPSLLVAIVLNQPGPTPPGSFCLLCRDTGELRPGSTNLHLKNNAHLNYYHFVF